MTPPLTGEEARIWLEGYMAGADVKFWFAFILVGAAAGVGIVVGMLF
jgi:hypothetical protein